MQHNTIAMATCLFLWACGTSNTPPSGDDSFGGGGDADAVTVSAGGHGGHAVSAGGSGGSGAHAGAGGSDFGGYAETGPIVCDGPGARFATEVVEAVYGPGQDHGRDAMPSIALGPPRGGGANQGSLDVVSLGNGGRVAVAFEGNGIVDGPGIDFVVFENAFEAGGGVFAELGTVEVSVDGITWQTFPCTASESPFGSCAGHSPVYLDGDDGPIDPGSAGGDGFDLATIDVTDARYVRITDRADLTGFNGVFDLDAVGIVNATCP